MVNDLSRCKPLLQVFFVTDDLMEAYALIKDHEPTTPQEYIIKAVVNAALGQEQGSVLWERMNWLFLPKCLVLHNEHGDPPITWKYLKDNAISNKIQVKSVAKYNIKFFAFK